MDSKEIKRTKAWVKKFVIGFNLCPFAKYPYFNDQIRYSVYKGFDLNELTKLYIEELILLDKTSSNKMETTLLIVPNILNDFLNYCDYLPLAQDLLTQLHLEGIIQLASFHPYYQFAETETNDVRNFTNRSPYPMFHLLREASVEIAVESHPDVSQIPIDNQNLMQKLGEDYLINFLNDITGKN